MVAYLVASSDSGFLVGFYFQVNETFLVEIFQYCFSLETHLYRPCPVALLYDLR